MYFYDQIGRLWWDPSVGAGYGAMLAQATPAVQPAYHRGTALIPQPAFGITEEPLDRRYVMLAQQQTLNAQMRANQQRAAEQAQRAHRQPLWNMLPQDAARTPYHPGAAGRLWWDPSVGAGYGTMLAQQVPHAFPQEIAMPMRPILPSDTSLNAEDPWMTPAGGPMSKPTVSQQLAARHVPLPSSPLLPKASHPTHTYQVDFPFQAYVEPSITARSFMVPRGALAKVMGIRVGSWEKIRFLHQGHNMDAWYFVGAGWPPGSATRYVRY